MVWASSQLVYVTIYFSFVSSSPHYLASFHLVTTSPCCFTHITMSPCHLVTLYHTDTPSPYHFIIVLILALALSSPSPCPHHYPHLVPALILILIPSSSSFLPHPLIPFLGHCIHLLRMREHCSFTLIDLSLGLPGQEILMERPSSFQVMDRVKTVDTE